MQKLDRLVETLQKDAKLPIPELVLLKSPFRYVVKPIVEYALQMERRNLEKHIAVVFAGIDGTTMVPPAVA